MYLVDILLHWSYEKYHPILGYGPKTLLANQFAEFIIFDLFDFFILVQEVHYYIVLVSIIF